MSPTAPSSGTISSRVEVGAFRPDYKLPSEGSHVTLVRTLVEQDMKFCFHRPCTWCGKQTPNPTPEVLQGLFGGSCWVWPFEQWHPAGWVKVVTEKEFLYLCENCSPRKP